MNIPEEEKTSPEQDQPSPNQSEGFTQPEPVDIPDGEENANNPSTQDLKAPIDELIVKFNYEEEPEFDFSELEASARANIQNLGFAPLPENEQPARRRRARKPLIARIVDEEIPERLEALAERAIPTFDFFIFTIIAGSLMGIGFLLNAPAVLLLSIVLAPFPAPLLGISLSAATAESQFFGQTIGGFFTAILIIFITGLLSGLTSRIFMPILLDQAYLHARLWWPDILLGIIGTSALVLLFSQKEEKPILPGLLVNYILLLPISAAGFGLGNGTPGLWPQGLAIFLVYLALAIVLGLAIFYYLGFRPIEPIGYAWGAGVILVSLMIVIGFAGLGTLVPVPQPISESKPTPTLQATAIPPSPVPVTATETTPTPTPVPPTITAMPSETPRPSPTPVLIPTTAYGRIQSRQDGDGATIRTSPGGSAITTILNGYVVEILPDAPVNIGNDVWIRVKVTTTTRVIEGWVLQSLVVTPTPQP